MKKKIYLKDWLLMKPYESSKPTDTYYVKMANGIRPIVSHKDYLLLTVRLNETEINMLCCFLVSYFEDVVSGTNIFATFRKEHKKRYQKPLPFYSTKGYYEDEINTVDVAFLVWYFLNTLQPHSTKPFNKVFLAFAKEVMRKFDEVYEYAPENNALKPYYTLDENETDYYEVRGMLETILLKTYLFYPDTKLEIDAEEEPIFEEYSHHENLVPMLQDNLDNFIYKVRTRLLALSVMDWAAGILGDEHPLHSDIRSMSQRISGYFLYKGQDEKTLYFEHISSQMKFALTKLSLDHHASFGEIDRIVFMGIVRWQKEWWFSGVSYQMEFDADFVMNEKKSRLSKRQVAFLNFEHMEKNGILKRQEKAFLDFNNGSTIAFIKGEEFNDFISAFNNRNNKSLDPLYTTVEDDHKRSEHERFLNDQTNPDFDISEEFEEAVVFFNPKGGIEVAFNCASAFPAVDNPYFNSEESDSNVHYILTSDRISKELANYCLDNYKEELTFFNDNMNKKLLKDIDFLLRFWKTRNYHSEPQITMKCQDAQLKF